MVENLFLIMKGFMKVGGLESLITNYGYAVAETTIFSNSTCGVPNSNYLDLVRDLDSDFPWLGMSFGLLISAVWYWCSESVFFVVVFYSNLCKHKN